MAFILKLILALNTDVGSLSPQYPQPHGARALETPHFRSPRSGVTRVCAAQDGLKNCALYLSKKLFNIIKIRINGNISKITINNDRKANMKMAVI